MYMINFKVKKNLLTERSSARSRTKTGAMPVPLQYKLSTGSYMTTASINIAYIGVVTPARCDFIAIYLMQI